MEVCNNKDLWPELTLEMIQIARLLDLGIIFLVRCGVTGMLHKALIRSL